MNTNPPTTPRWPYTPEMAARSIAAVAWPGEAREQRDEWAPKMLSDADLRDRTVDRARGYFEAAVRALLDQPTEEPPRRTVAELIEAGSFGTPEAKALRESVSCEDAARVVARAKTLSDSQAGGEQS